MWPAAHAGRHRFAQLPEHGVPSTRPSRTIADDGVVIAFPLDGSTVPCFAPLRFGDCFLTLPSQLTPQLLSDRCLQGPSRISVIGRCRRPLSASAAAGHEDCPVNVRVLVPTGVPRHLECLEVLARFLRVPTGRRAHWQARIGSTCAWQAHPACGHIARHSTQRPSECAFTNRLARIVEQLHCITGMSSPGPVRSCLSLGRSAADSYARPIHP